MTKDQSILLFLFFLFLFLEKRVTRGYKFTLKDSKKVAKSFPIEKFRVPEEVKNPFQLI